MTRPRGDPMQVMEQIPSIKEEPAAEELEPADSATNGVKREAESSADAETVAKRIKLEPV